MKCNTTRPNFTKILISLYIIVSLVTMATFFFTTTAKADEYIGFVSIAMWGAVFAVVIAIAVAIGAIAACKK